MAQSKLLPFHESIIKAIEIASSNDLVTLASLIKMTIIPDGHDEIKSAWDKRRKGLSLGDDFGVTEHLQNQKELYKS